jgi:aquaporin Z
MTTPKLLTEFLGTFFLVLVIALVVNADPMSPLAALAIGLVLMAMVYMGGHVSGAHYNPAVSLAVLLRKGLGPAEMGAYWITQLAGGVLGAVVGQLLIGRSFAPQPGSAVGIGPALLAEVLFTFALVLVVLNVAVSRRTAGNSYYGLAIGMTVAVAAVAIAPVSGAALNPAVGLGLTAAHALVGGGSWGSAWWLYVVGPLAGAVLAALVFALQEGPAAGEAAAEPQPTAIQP